MDVILEGKVINKEEITLDIITKTIDNALDIDIVGTADDIDTIINRIDSNISNR